ncbi:hypothetical protein DAPPUDRAFT_52115, partial [Daphnia pulex]
IIPSRYIFTALVSMGLAIIYGLKVNLSVAIVVMINSTELNAITAAESSHQSHRAAQNVSYYDKGIDLPEFACDDPNFKVNETFILQDGPFVWTEPVQGLILGSYFWGYILTQIPGGRIAEKYSAKWVIWGAVMTNVVSALFTPFAANKSYIAVLVVRFIQGLGAGVSSPAIHVMLTKWVLPKERNLMSSLIYAGTALGTVISLPFSGILASVGGWESVFYVEGGLALIWCVLWLLFIYDSPEEHPRINSEELNLFKSYCGDNRERKCLPPVPWKALTTSGPFWAILVAHTCANFGWYMLLVELPTYMKAILRFNISQNSALSAIPYLSLWVFSIVWSNRLDWAKGKGWISTTTVRKLSTAVASLLPAACLIGVALVGCNREAAVALVTIGTMFVAGMYCGFLTNHVDIAPNYAGTLMALTNTVATIPGFIVPAFVGQLTHGNQTLGQWQIIFYTTAAIYVVEFVVYAALASGEEQSWNRVLQHKNSNAQELEECR